jgi:hypothetical protein
MNQELGSYEFYNIRTTAILTNSYVAGIILGPVGLGSSATQIGVDPSKKNQLNLYVAFTKGSLTTAEVKVEFSHDGVNYYQETASAVTGGNSAETLLVHQFSASGNYRILVPIKDNFVKISANGTGTVTASSMTIDAIQGTV